MEPTTAPELIREIVGDVSYEYYPLGEYVVVAPGVCGGRPTFKYTRLEVSQILALLGVGYSIEELIDQYEASRLTHAAVQEAIRLAEEAFSLRARDTYPLAI
jgi:uncharacterized protein (DUF433 family)